MAVSILIATPSQAFGELIRETLMEADEYQPVLATNLNGLIQRAQRGSFDLLILDLDMAGVALSELWQAIQKSTPEIRLAAISWQGAEDSTILNSIKPDGLLTKPFYAPDLVKAIQSILSADKPSPRAEPILTQGEFAQAPKDMNTIPTGEVDQPDVAPVGSEPTSTKGMDISWLEDVTRAAQHLTRLSLEADALAALITRNEQLWSYAGQLPKPAAEELAQIVLRDWSDRVQTGISDLVCFVHLQSTGEEYMLYATRLDEEMALALAFDAQTPFSRIRTQASHLARALAEPPNGFAPDLSATTSSSGFSQEPDSLNAFFEETVEEEDLGAEFPVEPLFPLEIVPPPTPDQSESDQLSSKAVNRSGEEEKPDEEMGRENIPKLYRPVRTIPQSALDLATEQFANPVEMDSDTHGIFSLQYACTLIPRLPHHHLTGKLASQLNLWMRQLNLAFGWRLEYLAIRPGYLNWVSNVTPETSSAILIKRIRTQTSMRIFEEFPHFIQENPSGDFWASTYMVLTASQPPPGKLLKEFIEQTRREQGIHFTS